MVEMAIQFLYWEVGFIAKRTHDFFVIISFLVLAAITVINLLLWYFRQTVTGQMETSITGIAIQDLVRVIIETTKANFAIRLKEFLFGCLVAFSWAKHLLVLNEGLKHFHCFIVVSMLKIF